MKSSLDAFSRHGERLTIVPSEGGPLNPRHLVGSARHRICLMMRGVCSTGAMVGVGAKLKAGRVDVGVRIGTRTLDVGA